MYVSKSMIIIQEPNGRNILNMSDLTIVVGCCWHVNNTEEEEEKEFDIMNDDLMQIHNCIIM